jgi:hypothetical protein
MSCWTGKVASMQRGKSWADVGKSLLPNMREL